MRVFNLTDTTKIFKGKPIPPNGGFVDFPGLDFIPNRDRELEVKKVLAFGSLPTWFIEKQNQVAQAAVRNALVTLPSKVVVEDAVEATAKAPETKTDKVETKKGK